MAERITGQTDRQTDRSRFLITKDFYVLNPIGLKHWFGSKFNKFAYLELTLIASSSHGSD